LTTVSHIGFHAIANHYFSPFLSLFFPLLGPFGGGKGASYHRLRRRHREVACPEPAEGRETPQMGVFQQPAKGKYPVDIFCGFA
jgi:hypothetical protein